MKIHLGCGNVYKKGYVNVDAYDESVADKIMFAHQLEFEDNVAKLIECIQMIEHLGAAKSIYAVSEMFRVLQPEGILVIETPDIEKAFQRFLKKGEEDRKYLMNWIYGLDIPGMLHRYCFPMELLSRMLQEAGFVDVKITQINSKSNQPALRAICRKPKQYVMYQTISRMRRRLAESGVVDLDDQVKTLEQENLIQQIIRIVHESQDNIEVENLSKLVVEAAVVCPDVGLVFFTEAIIQELIQADKVNPLIKILQSFSDLKLPAVLLHLLMSAPVKIGTQEQIFSSIKAMGVKAVEKALTGNEEEVFTEIRNTHKDIDSNLEFSVFSKTQVDLIAEKKLAFASKTFAEERFSEAFDQYNDVLKLNRNNMKALWNMARIEGLRGSKENAEEYYEQVKSLARFFKLPIQRFIIKRINIEMEFLSNKDVKQLSKPLLDLV